MVEVGKSYKCKNGCTFTCERHNPDDRFEYLGWITKPDGSRDRIAWYTASGRYTIAPSKYDLVFN